MFNKEIQTIGKIILKKIKQNRNRKLEIPYLQT
jgi:hypothetical protein